MVVRFVRALIKGYEYVGANPELALKTHLLSRNPGLSEEVSKKRWAAHASVFSNPWGEMSEAMFVETYQRLERLGVLDKPFDPRDAFDASVLSEARKHPNKTVR